MSGLAALVWSPFPDPASARRCVDRLLEEGLVACANILPPMQSLYVWEGERGQAEEVGVLFKTNGDLLELAVARIDELHPYETPAVIGWHADRTNPAAGAWLGALGPGAGPA